jgi:7-cyano-7-deazaguanine synthase in queuosine biosynthesis
MIWDVIARLDDDYIPETEITARLLLEFGDKKVKYHIRGNPIELIKQEVGFSPTSLAEDFLRIAISIYSADRCVLRSYFKDNWNRKFRLHIPVSSVDAWASVTEKLQATVGFLSGDTWSFCFRPLNNNQTYDDLFDSRKDIANVSLFSGGLDSLIGAIDLLQKKKDVYFVGHYSSPITSKFQKDIYEELENYYGIKKKFSSFFVSQPKIKGHDEAEPTMRTRSILFLGLGVATATALACKGNLYIPENGFISLNVPMTFSRHGALSTRTTQPYFIEMIQDILNQVGIRVSLKLPYGFDTKGEMMSRCLNKKLLEETLSLSMSCSHPEQARYSKSRPGIHCGRCLPCLVRRAACFYSELSEKDTEYLHENVKVPPPAINGAGEDFRAILMGINRFKNEKRLDDFRNVIGSGPLPGKDIDRYVDVYRRGMNELAVLLTGSNRK